MAVILVAAVLLSLLLGGFVGVAIFRAANPTHAKSNPGGGGDKGNFGSTNGVAGGGSGVTPSHESTGTNAKHQEQKEQIPSQSNERKEKSPSQPGGASGTQNSHIGKASDTYSLLTEEQRLDVVVRWLKADGAGAEADANANANAQAHIPYEWIKITLAGQFAHWRSTEPCPPDYCVDEDKRMWDLHREMLQRNVAMFADCDKHKVVLTNEWEREHSGPVLAFEVNV